MLSAQPNLLKPWVGIHKVTKLYNNPAKGIPTITTDSSGYAMISGTDGKFYYYHLDSYLSDSLGITGSGVTIDTAYVENDSVCFVMSSMDTICVDDVVGGGITDKNFFEHNITQPGDRTHNQGGFNTTINNVGSFTLDASNGMLTEILTFLEDYFEVTYGTGVFNLTDTTGMFYNTKYGNIVRTATEAGNNSVAAQISAAKGSELSRVLVDTLGSYVTATNNVEHAKYIAKRDGSLTIHSSLREYNIGENAFGYPPIMSIDTLLSIINGRLYRTPVDSLGIRIDTGYVENDSLCLVFSSGDTLCFNDVVGSGTDLNFAEDDLTLPEDRTHDMNNKSVTYTDGNFTAWMDQYLILDNRGDATSPVIKFYMDNDVDHVQGLAFQKANGQQMWGLYEDPYESGLPLVVARYVDGVVEDLPLYIDTLNGDVRLTNRVTINRGITTMGAHDFSVYDDQSNGLLGVNVITTSVYQGLINITDTGFDFSTDSPIRPISFSPNGAGTLYVIPGKVGVLESNPTGTMSVGDIGVGASEITLDVNTSVNYLGSFSLDDTGLRMKTNTGARNLYFGIDTEDRLSIMGGDRIIMQGTEANDVIPMWSMINTSAGNDNFGLIDCSADADDYAFGSDVSADRLVLAKGTNLSDAMLSISSTDGSIRAPYYDATPPTGTPFRLIGHETDGDYIAAEWQQVADSIANLLPSDSIFSQNGLICIVTSAMDTICGDTSFYDEDLGEFCVVDEGDTTCVLVDQGIGNVYTIDGFMTDDRDVGLNGKYLRIFEGAYDRFFIPTEGNPVEIGLNTSATTSSVLRLRQNHTNGDNYILYDHTTDYSVGFDKSENAFTWSKGSDLSSSFLRHYSSTDQISIDGTTLWVDATNNRVGIQNSAPSDILTIGSGTNYLRWNGSTLTTFGTNYSLLNLSTTQSTAQISMTSSLESWAINVNSTQDFSIESLSDAAVFRIEDEGTVADQLALKAAGQLRAAAYDATPPTGTHFQLFGHETDGDIVSVDYDVVADSLEAHGLTGGSYTDEQAQDAVGAMIDASLNYVDGTPLLQRAALTGEVTASAGSNTTAIDKTAITGKTLVTAATGDHVLIADASDSDNLKKVTVQTIVDLASGSGANTALSNLASVAINTALILGTSDAAALGSSTKQWSDLYLAEGGVIDFDAGDATITQAGDVVTVAGADLKVSSPGTTSTSVATLDGTQTLQNKRINKRVVALSDGANIAVNSDNTDIGTVTLGGNRQLDNPTGTPVDGQLLEIRYRQDGTGTRTIVYGTAYRFGTDITGTTLTTTAGKTDYALFQYNSTDSKWDCVSFVKGY